ncbi:MAG: ABC transporter ATP-binding protein [Ruminococcaceae bacterium]|nr:ABC transporter ATP-binding protein [Oscillospiraceae bacterium]
MGPDMGMPPPRGPRMGPKNEHLRVPRPKSIREVPSYLKKVIGGFLRRLFYIVKLVWDTNHWILLGMMLLTLFHGVLPVAGEYVNAAILNALAESLVDQSLVLESFIGLFVIRFAIMLFSRLVTTFDNLLNRLAGEMVANHIKVQLMTKSDEIDIARFDLPEFYENLENANREAGSRPVQILSATFSMISTVISMVSFIVVLAAVSTWAPLLIIMLALPSAIINFVYRHKKVTYIRYRSKDRREMQYYSGLMTNKDMVKEIRVFSLGKTFIERYKAVFKKYFGGLKKLILQEHVWNVSLVMIKVGVNCGLLLYIADKVIKGQIKVGSYSLYSGALNSIANGVNTLITTTATIYEGALFIDNVIAFMDEKKTMKSILDKPIKPVRRQDHTITFENVSFSYPGSDRLVLKNVSFTLNPGETAVLVGVNGAGKTTLIKLLMRLYDPTEGRILMDGHDIREFAPEEYYRMFGVIFQDFGKYAVNVTENIAFGDIDKEPTDDRIRDAAERSGADAYIEKLSDGYQTPLMRIFEENGVELSGGQWQKLAIARAFFSDSDIIILDEPTAALDALAEQEIYMQFDELRKNKITIFVSHRLSSATVASKILVFEDGMLREEGNHTQLMAKEDGIYRKLFTAQASRYISEEHNMNIDGKEDNTHEKSPVSPRRHPHSERRDEQMGGDRL